MSAIFASFLSFLKKGDHLISCNAVFGSTHTIITKYLPKFGIEYTYVNVSNPGEWEAAIRPNTKMIYLETPTNPGLEIVDLQAPGHLARNPTLTSHVTNSFAT